MARFERRPSLLSAQRKQSGQNLTTRRGLNRGMAKVFQGLSITGVGSTGKDLFSSDLECVLPDVSMIEVYVAATGTIGGGQNMTMSLRMDGTDFKVLYWLSVNGERRYTDPTDFNGTTATRGAFLVRLDDLAAGYHAFNFRFKTSAGTGSASSINLAYRIL